jgi:hypothetical protein
MFNLQTVDLTLPYLEHAKECFACGTNYYTFGTPLPVAGLCSRCNAELITMSKEDELFNEQTNERNFEL